MISVRQIVPYALAKLVPGLIMFLSVPVLVSTVGVRGYGVYSSSWALTTFISSLSSGWLRSAALRATGDTEMALGRISPIIFGLLIIVPAPLVMVWATLADGWRDGESPFLVAVAGGAFAVSNGAYWLITTRTQRDGRATRFAIAEAVRTALGLLSAVGLRLAGSPGATSALLGYTTATAVATIIAAGPHLPPLVGREKDPKVLRSYWRYGWPMSLWLAASTGLVYADRFVVTTLLGPTIGGKYAAIADLTVRGTAMLASPMIMALHPSIMRAWNLGDRSRAVGELRRGTQVLIAILALGVVGGTLIGPPVVRAIIHESVQWPIVAGLALGAAAWQVGQLTHKPYELVAKNVEMLVVATLAMLGTLALEVVLTSLIGIGGPVIAFCAGACGYASACSLAGRRLLRQPKLIERLGGIDVTAGRT